MSKVSWCLSRRDEIVSGESLRWVQVSTSDNVKYVQAWVDCWFDACRFFLDEPDSIRGDLLLIGTDKISGREVWREELTQSTHSHGLDFNWFYNKFPQYKPQQNIRN